MVFEFPASPQILVVSAVIIASSSVVCTADEKIELAAVDLSFEEAVAHLDSALEASQSALMTLSGATASPAEIAEVVAATTAAPAAAETTAPPAETTAPPAPPAETTAPAAAETTAPPAPPVETTAPPAPPAETTDSDYLSSLYDMWDHEDSSIDAWLNDTTMGPTDSAGCKCGVELTSRIVGGTEVNPVGLKYILLFKFLIFIPRKTNIPGWRLLFVMEVSSVEEPWWPLSTSSLPPTA